MELAKIPKKIINLKAEQGQKIWLEYCKIAKAAYKKTKDNICISLNLAKF